MADSAVNLQKNKGKYYLTSPQLKEPGGNQGDEFTIRSTTDYEPENDRTSVTSVGRAKTPVPSQKRGSAKLRRTPSRRDQGSPDSGAVRDVLITQLSSDEDERVLDGRSKHPAYDDDDEVFRKSPTWKLFGEPQEDGGYDTDLDIGDLIHSDEEESYDPTGAKDYIKECNRLGVIPTSYFLRHVHDQDFIMRNHGLGPYGAKAIAKPLSINTHIDKLDLEGNCVESRGAIYLSRMLRENIIITDLVLSENDLGGEGGAAVCDMMMDNRTIKTLDLSGNNLKDTDGEMFYRVLEKNQMLQRLTLRHNQFEHHAAYWFQLGLSANESLRMLDLSWNHLRLQGARSIAEGVQENYGLKELFLSMNGFGYHGAKQMGQALKQNQSLETLDLSNNRIPSEGALEIAKALKIHEHLQILKLGQNPIDPTGATPLIMAIQRNESSTMALLCLEGIMVMEEFDNIQTEINDGGGRRIHVVHAGVICDNEIRLPPPMKVDPELLFWSDPMTKLKRYANEIGFRLVDVFRQFDKDNSWTVDREEFIMGVKSKKIPLTEEEIDILINRLDQDGDGEIDYKELAEGDQENRSMQIKVAMLNKEREQEEQEKANRPPTPVKDILDDD